MVVLKYIYVERENGLALLNKACLFQKLTPLIVEYSTKSNRSP